MSAQSSTLTKHRYYEITETKAIVRVIGTNPNGLLIADVLHGVTDKGWWRLVAIAPDHLAKNATEVPDFVDNYPQHFLPKH
jgi:hypothetical protein